MTTRSLPSSPRPVALALHSLLLAGGLALAGSALAKPIAQGGSFWVFKLPSWDKTTAKR